MEEAAIASSSLIETCVHFGQQTLHIWIIIHNSCMDKPVSGVLMKQLNVVACYAHSGRQFLEHCCHYHHQLGVVLECCREVLEKRVVEMCCREVLEKSVVETSWRREL